MFSSHSFYYLCEICINNCLWSLRYILRIYEHGQEEFLKRLSNPFFFQSFGCALGFDWHSSGLTTTVTGALKELNKENLGIAVCGGKGAASRKTPDEIESFAESFSLNNAESLIYSSKMSAKVDNTTVQDGYNLYHHVFIFTEKGRWCVIQQGLNYVNRYARRYHWLEPKTFTNEPHAAICCDARHENILNMVAKQSAESRKASVDLVNDNVGKRLSVQNTLNEFTSEIKKLSLPRHHDVRLNKQTVSALQKAYELQPENYEELLAIKGIGPKAVRSLALVSQLIYGAEPSWKDPVKFSFAHGGKDGYPEPVDRRNYDKSIEMLRVAIDNAKIGDSEKLQAIRRLNEFI